MSRKDILERECEIKNWINDNIPKSEIARRLNCGIHTLEVYLKKMGVLYSGNKGGRNVRTFNNPRYLPFAEYIKVGNVQSNKLRIKLLKEGLKQPICERCKNSEWQGQLIPLEVHHIDGNKSNNELHNLQLLCPNCHALTPTYRGKNIKK